MGKLKTKPSNKKQLSIKLQVPSGTENFVLTVTWADTAANFSALFPLKKMRSIFRATQFKLVYEKLAYHADFIFITNVGGRFPYKRSLFHTFQASKAREKEQETALHKGHNIISFCEC